MCEVRPITTATLLFGILCVSHLQGVAGQDRPEKVYRIGGEVSAPELKHEVKPEYSEEARLSKYQGIAVLWIIVQQNGTVGDARVARSLGLGLDEKALEAVKQWRFKPAEKGGRPVAVTMAVEVLFKLCDPIDFKSTKRSAEQGDASAQLGLGLMYETGCGPLQDLKAAMVWYQKAASQQNRDAKYSLGNMYENGEGVAADDVEAYMWYSLAANDGLSLAKSAQSRVSSRMTPTQIAQAEALARQWTASGSRR